MAPPWADFEWWSLSDARLYTQTPKPPPKPPYQYFQQTKAIFQMDNFDDLSAVNLDDGRDFDCSVSPDENDRIDRKGLYDQNDSARMDALDCRTFTNVDMTGNESLVIARGGFTCLSLEGSAEAIGLSKNIINFLCNLQFTKDAGAFCVTEINLDNATSKTMFDPKEKTYNINGNGVQGHFMLDYTGAQIYNINVKDLAVIKAYASDIMVPKEYIWPVKSEKYLGPPTTVVPDAHNQGLEVYASSFANDFFSSYSYNYYPTTKYLQFIVKGEYVVSLGCKECFVPIERGKSIEYKMLCDEMILDDSEKVIMRSSTYTHLVACCGMKEQILVTAEAKRVQSSWFVLDRRLKGEADAIIELDCQHYFLAMRNIFESPSLNTFNASAQSVP